MRKKITRDEIGTKAKNCAEHQNFRRFDRKSSLRQIILQFRRPRPSQHQLVQPRHSTHHFVADEFQAKSDVTAAFRFVHCAHALADLFLAALGAGKNPDAKKNDNHDQERQDGDQCSHCNAPQRIGEASNMLVGK